MAVKQYSEVKIIASLFLLSYSIYTNHKQNYLVFKKSLIFSHYIYTEFVDGNVFVFYLY